MKERPILFSAPMVRAILTGRKTQTRRAVKPRGGGVLGVRDDATVREVRSGEWSFGIDGPRGWSSLASPFASPYGAPGDRLWVRETFASFTRAGSRCRPTLAEYVVLSDGTQKARDGKLWPPLAEYAAGSADHIKWRPSIHMPQWASRITLEVTGVRVERLQDIGEADAKAEGAAERISQGGDLAAAFDLSNVQINYRAHFAGLWRSINGDDAWDANPWVWCVSFKRVTP